MFAIKKFWLFYLYFFYTRFRCQTPFIQQQQQQQQHHVPLQPHVHTRTQQPLSQETLLKRENERLQNELRALQASMGSVQQAQVEESRLSSPVVVSSGARTGPYSASSTAAPTQQSVLQTRPMSIHDIQQRQLQIQQQLQNNRTQTQTQTNQPQPQTQQQLSTSTSNEQATLKYVCCGSCRQWLSSPRDAAFVYCPGN
jgi:LSD1 subclass zinc finger protein